ncbi:MAG: hypothetical protein ACFE85_09275 [Candidatus Hodarchaeota archaeon]
MKNITILLNRVWFPADQSSKVAKAFIDALKEVPPDNTIEKNLAIFVSSEENGNILAYGIGEIMGGKEKEALQRNIKQNLFMASKVDGIKYKSEVLLDFREAYKILGMTAPEEV